MRVAIAADPPTTRSCCPPPRPAAAVCNPPAEWVANSACRSEKSWGSAANTACAYRFQQKRAAGVRVLRSIQDANVSRSHSAAPGAAQGTSKRHPLRHPFEPQLRLREVGARELRQGRHRAGEATAAPGEIEQVVAVGVGGKRHESELGDQRAHAVLARSDPLAAELDGAPTREGVVQHAAADAFARFEHEHVAPGRAQPARRGQAGEARPHDRDIGRDAGGRLLPSGPPSSPMTRSP